MELLHNVALPECKHPYLNDQYMRLHPVILSDSEEEEKRHSRQEVDKTLRREDNKFISIKATSLRDENRCKEARKNRRLEISIQENCHPEDLPALQTDTSSQSSSLACSFCIDSGSQKRSKAFVSVIAGEDPQSHNCEISHVCDSDLRQNNVKYLTNILLTHFKKAAYTLTEVLITLGIIGIVAALTMPGLAAKYQKNQTVSRLKASYSILNNAIEMAKVDYGTDINSWDIPEVGNTFTPHEASAYFAEHYLLPYLKVIKKCDGKNDTEKCYDTIYQLKGDAEIFDVENPYSFVLANGSTIILECFVLGNRQRILTYIDINGSTKPNTLGKDVFLTEMGYYGNKDYKYAFNPYAYAPENSRSYYKDYDTTACNTNSQGIKCFSLIMHDGWEIKDDYPW